MVVCHCYAVNDQRVCEAIRSGALDPDTVAEHCGAGAGCGGCRSTIELLLATAGAPVG
jgi:bacterioferritin-associated ferredoxin